MVATMMQKPFPFVDSNASLEEVSKLITKDNAAVMVKDNIGDTHIITKQDIIETIG